MKICYLDGPGGGKVCAKRFCGPERLRTELQKRLIKEIITTSVSLGRNPQKIRNLKRRSLKHPGVILSAFNAVKRSNPQIIHCHGGMKLTLILLLLKYILGKKTVLTFTEFKKTSLPFSILNKIDVVIVQTEFARNKLIKNGVKEKKLHLIPYGVEDAFYESKKHQDIRDLGKKMVLYYGDARLERGFGLFLESIKLLPPDFFILLCLRGFDDFSRVRLDHFAKQRGNMKIIGVDEYPCPIQDIIKSSDVVVLPFLHNTLEPPLSVMEVAAVGKNLVTTQVGGIPEVAGSNSLFLKKNDPKELSDLIEHSMTQKNDLVRNFDWAVTLKKIGQIYETFQDSFTKP